MAPQFVLQQQGHRAIERGQHLVEHFNEGDVLAEVDELFGHFQADEAGADHRDPLCGFGRGLEVIHVLHGTESDDARVVDPGKGGSQGCGTRGEKELVVAQPGG